MSVCFSIVVPCYNTEKTIGATLDSIKNQTYDNYEIIAVNDGSADNTLRVLEKYEKENNVNISIVNQSNRGLGGARNAGIKTALSDYVAFLDADDLWYSEKLVKINDVIEAHKDVDLVCNDEDVIQDGKLLRKNVYGPYRSYDDLLFKGNCLSGSATVVRKDKLFDVGLFTENRLLHGVEDYDMWMKLALARANFFYLHEVLGGYVFHENNMTNDIEAFMKRSLRLMRYHFSNYPRKDLIHRIMFRRAVAQTLRSGARQFLLKENYKTAKKYAFQSLETNIFSAKNLLVALASLTKIKI